MDRFNLERHPLSSAYPDIPDAELEQIQESVEQQGFTNPNVWLLDGMVLDGWHRYRIARRMSRMDDLDFLDYEGDDPVGFVISLNDARRHLDASQRAVVAYKLSSWSTPGGDRKSENQSVNLSNDFTQQEAADSLRVSRSSVQQAGTVLRDDSNATPELREAVETGSVTVSDAARIVQESPEVQTAAVEAVQTGESRTLTGAVTKATDPPEPREPTRTEKLEMQIEELQRILAEKEESIRQLEQLNKFLSDQQSEFAPEREQEFIRLQRDYTNVSAERNTFMVKYNDLNRTHSGLVRVVRQKDTEIETLKGQINQIEGVPNDDPFDFPLDDET